MDRLRPYLGGRDALQAYCDLLEHKWLLSEGAQRDVGMEMAFGSYVAEGAPAPEVRSSADGSEAPAPALDIDRALAAEPVSEVDQALSAEPALEVEATPVSDA